MQDILEEMENAPLAFTDQVTDNWLTNVGSSLRIRELILVCEKVAKETKLCHSTPSSTSEEPTP